MSRPNKAFRGHPGPRTEFLRYLDFLPEDTSLCKPYRYMPPQKGYSFCPFFGLKTGINFVYFGLESGMVFEGTTGV